MNSLGSHLFIIQLARGAEAEPIKEGDEETSDLPPAVKRMGESLKREKAKASSALGRRSRWTQR